MGFRGTWPEALLTDMMATLAHRGPDGAGKYYARESEIGLAHTRLAIIDLNASADQPMTSADGRYVITYNGEIYNYRELRSELIARGSQFRTESDTEVLLELFARDGIACLNRLSGIFAFGIWDKQERRLVLVRDQLGVKPLYYAALNEGVVFASEIKALLHCAEIPPTIDPAAVAAYMGFLWTADERTMLEGVKKLRPGQYAIIDDGGFRSERYYQARSWPDAIPTRNRGRSEDFLQLFDNVVADQMVADVSVGALLSGGVDSSAIVASMVRAVGAGQVKCFCASVSNAQGGADNIGDDLPHARQVASRLGVELIEVPTESDLIDSLPEMLWQLDEPSADFAALQAGRVAAVAHGEGLKVLMSGVGGDDLLTGYPRHRLALLRAWLDRVPGARHSIAGILGKFSPSSRQGRRLARISQLLRMPADQMAIEAMSFSAVDEAGRCKLLSTGTRQGLANRATSGGLDHLARESDGQHAVLRQLDLELNAFVPDHNLNYVDKMSMHASVEVRVPFLDTRLVEFAASLPLRRKIGPLSTKKILRESQAARLPTTILDRPKQGFGVPVRSWLQADARPLLEDLTSTTVIAERGLFDPVLVNDLKARFFRQEIDAAQTLFAIMAIEIWCRAHDQFRVTNRRHNAA